MGNGPEARTWYEQVADESLAYASSAKKLDDGEAATVDGSFALAYQTRISNRRQRVGKVALMVRRGVSVYSGPDTENLTEHVFPPETQGPLDIWHIKVNDAHRILKIEERELRISERPVGYDGFELRINSPTPFILDRMGVSLRFSDMRDRFLQQLQRVPQA